jgi:hypothetical protein
MALYQGQTELKFHMMQKDSDKPDTTQTFTITYAEALTKFYQHYKQCVLDEIQSRENVDADGAGDGKLSKESKESKVRSVKEEEIQWMISVPAIWSSSSRNTVQQAAKKAGLTHVKIVLESEASSVVCAVHEHAPEKGESYIVLDLGGGTADTTVHKILNYDKNEAVELAEMICHDGGPWGSAKVECEFVQFLSQQLGENELMHYAAENYLDWRQILDQFQMHIKHKARYLRGNDQTKASWLTMGLPMSFKTKFSKQLGDSTKKNTESVQTKDDVAKSNETPTPPASAAPATQTPSGWFPSFWPFSSSVATTQPTQPTRRPLHPQNKVCPLPHKKKLKKKAIKNLDIAGSAIPKG